MSVKVVAFCCNWCSYAGADLAGTSRLQYPAEVKIIKIPCSCRVDPLFIMRAFQKGADGVIICGCHPGDCHYSTGNYFTRRRIALLFNMLDFIGIEKGRVHLEWVSASEGAKFARVMDEFTAKVSALGKNHRWMGERVVEDGVLDVPQISYGGNLGASRTPPPTDTNLSHRMRDRAKELLQSGEVQQVLAWKVGEYPWLPEPAFFSTAKALENLVYDKFCTANLTRYMVNQGEGKTLVFLRPCDSYSFNQLLTENQVKRENAYIIGVGCEGCVTVDEGEEKGLLEGCQSCTKTTHVVYDELLDADNMPRTTMDKNFRFAAVGQLEEQNADERYAFWQAQFAKCIRCNACRNICPTCNCKKCVFDGDKYDTQQKANISKAEEQMFHVTRAFHVAGRCTDCGQCSRVCPQHIPLHLLNRKFIKDINSMFGEYQAGENIEAPAPLTSFNSDTDPEPRNSEGK